MPIFKSLKRNSGLRTEPYGGTTIYKTLLNITWLI